jgi:phage terminase large subunit-like protein
VAFERFAKLMSFVEGQWAGQPVKFLPWQVAIVRALLDTTGRDGCRQYRKALIGTARKAGKTTFFAVLALYWLLVESEKDPGAQIYSIAAEREQARLIFSTASRMLATAPALAAECEVLRDSIVFRRTGSAFRVLSAEAYSKHGLSPSLVLFDELHAQATRELWDVMSTGQGARLEPLIAAITTAGVDRDSICKELFDYGCQVRAGVVTDPAFFFQWFGAGPGDRWDDPATWRKANPSLGAITPLAFLEREAREAAALPARQSAFRQLYCNEWVQEASKWIDLGLWDEQAGACHAA